MKMLNWSARAGSILDNLTKKKIIYTGIIGLIIIYALIYFIAVAPIEQKVQEVIKERNDLQSEIEILKSDRASKDNMIISNHELPEALNFLRKCYLSNSLTVEEIIISPLPNEILKNYAQTAIKVTVSGNRLMVIKSVLESQNNGKYPFLMKELDISGDRAIIDYRILFIKGTV